MVFKSISKRLGSKRQKQELQRSQQLIKDKQITQAQELLHMIIEDDAECAYAHYLLGNTYFRESRDDEALKAYEEALRHNPKLSTAALMSGVIHKKRGDNEAARDYLESTIGLDPDSVVAYAQLGRTLQELGKTDEAIECVAHALSLNPQHLQGHLLMAELRAAAGETEVAASILSELVRDNPTLVAAWQALGLLKLRIEDLEGAKEVFKEATQVVPDRAILHYFLARIHFHLEEYNAAEAEFREVVDKVDSFKGAQYGLADALTECENYPAAVEILSALRKVSPRKNAVHQRFGLIYTRQGRYDAAVQEFRAALKTDPRFAESIPSVAALLEQQIGAEAPARQVADLFVESRNKQQIERAMQADAGFRKAKKKRSPASALSDASQALQQHGNDATV